MTPLLITRIEGVLDRQFAGLIDMSDRETRPEGQKRAAFLSRALAALCIKTLAGVSAEIAAKAVTDGFHDNSIDALFFDQRADALIIVQSHWSMDGRSSFGMDDTAKLVEGVRDLFSVKLGRFNEKVRAKEPEIRAAMFAERQVKFIIVTAHTGNQPIAPVARRKVDDLIEELNNPVPISEARHFDQSGVYSLITSESKPPKVKLAISLTDWGLINKPFLAHYGRVHVNEIAQWWAEHGNALFTQNLRFFYAKSDVNAALSKTLASNPEYFWYFNNGITVICDSLTKSAAGSPKREVGVFNCAGASIVNGAQTVGTIGNNWPVVTDSPQESGGDAWVQVRIISLADCPPEFARLVTRAANLQNQVGNREFAAMDPVQHRLATEFALDRKKYVYKAGEADPHGDEGCSIVEATAALACSKSVALAVQAKREIGELWVTDEEPYTLLFNSQTTAERVWRHVRILRAVERELQRLREADVARAELIAVHLNRLILHLVFQENGVKSLIHEHAMENDCLASAVEATKVLFMQVAEYVNTHHKEEYLAPLSKNQTKCGQLVKTLRPDGGKGQATLFAG